MNSRILVECKPDETLVEVLLDGKKALHLNGRSRVIKKLLILNEKSIGLVDEDPGKPIPKNFSKYFVIKHNLQDLDIKVFKHRNKESYLILLYPRLEEWILKTCEEADIPPGRFGLPNDPNRLHRIININVTGLIELLSHLKNKSKRLQKLKHLLTELLQKPY